MHFFAEIPFGSSSIDEDHQFFLFIFVIDVMCEEGKGVRGLSPDHHHHHHTSSSSHHQSFHRQTSKTEFLSRGINV